MAASEKLQKVDIAVESRENKHKAGNSIVVLPNSTESIKTKELVSFLQAIKSRISTSKVYGISLNPGMMSCAMA